MATSWTYEMIVEEAKKYETRNEFQKKNARAYSAARRRGILDDVCGHMETLSISWTYEMISEEAKKYQNKRDFNTKNPKALSAARRHGILDEVCAHMENLYMDWTYEMIAEEAKKYQNKSEFAKNNMNAYRVAHKRGILDEVCSHMKSVHTHLYIVKISHPHIDNLYKIGVSNNPKKRVGVFRSRSPFDEFGDVIYAKTDMCVQYEKEILEITEPYNFEKKFNGSGEIREIDEKTLKFILKKYFGVDKDI